MANPTLNHVMKKTSAGWQPTTIAEAEKEYPDCSVSARQHVFMCSLCGQYVTLTYGRKYVRYFKHISEDGREINCPEYIQTEPEQAISEIIRSVPLRLHYDNENSFRLQLGLPYVPQDILDQCSLRQIIIRNRAENEIYQYTFERLNEDSITYLNLGEIPSDIYELKIDPQLHKYWPSQIEGISNAGRLFDFSTMKSLSAGAQTVMNKAYLFLTSEPITGHTGSLVIESIGRSVNGKNKIWRVYKVIAKQFNSGSDEFFKRLGYILTDTCIHTQVVWPPYLEKSMSVLHDDKEVFVHVSGSNVVKTFLYANEKIRYEPAKFSLPKENERVYELVCSEREQLLCVNRWTQVLEILYFWKKEQHHTRSVPEILVTDSSGIEVNQGILHVLPKDGLLNIHVPYDGVIVLSKEGIIIRKDKVSGGKDNRISKVSWGMKAILTQGMTRAWEAEFIKEEKKISVNETERKVLLQLRSFRGDGISIPHSLGGLYSKLSRYPEIQRWLYTKIREGEMSRRAYLILMKTISEQ